MNDWISDRGVIPESLLPRDGTQRRITVKNELCQGLEIQRIRHSLRPNIFQAGLQCCAACRGTAQYELQKILGYQIGHAVRSRPAIRRVGRSPDGDRAVPQIRHAYGIVRLHQPVIVELRSEAAFG